MNWKLVQSIVGQPEIDMWGESANLVDGLGLLDLIASEPGSGLEKVDDHTYLVRKFPENTDHLIGSPDDPFWPEKPKTDRPKIDVLGIMFDRLDGNGQVKKLAEGVWQVPPGWV